jgi:NADH-quinone oxidoreductase subunit C
VEQNAIYELLAAHVGDGALGFTEHPLEPWAALAPAKVVEACRFLRDDPRLGFDQLMCLSGIDWDGLDEAGKGKSVAILGYGDDGQPEKSDRVATGDLGVAYHLYSHALKHKFTLRVRFARDAATVPTVSAVWSTASWHEREAWDLLGITFAGHPDPRRMLLEDDWVGHPLRKDYVMPSLWNGVPLQGQPYCANPFPVESGGPDQPAGDKPAEG